MKSEIIADMQALIDHVTALSMQYKTRISIATTPPQYGGERYVYVSIGQGAGNVEISGFADKLMCQWRAPDGSKQRARLSEVQSAIWEEQA